VNVQTALPELVGDLARFRALADRIEGLVEAEVARYRPGASDWIVLPWTDGFYLFSEDSEGQRRGREVVVAFLGPSVVSVETVPEGRLESMLPSAWQSTGLVRASYLRRVDATPGAAAEMLLRLEDMAASIAGHTRHRLEIRATPSDLLRDFRLALLRRDDESARSLLDEVRSTGHVSAENLRYLRIEYLAAFGRWTEMRSMPHMSALLQARRPRAVSETLLRMVWWTELVGPGHRSTAVAFKERSVLEEFGPLLRSVRTPSTAEGRLVCFLTALADSDIKRQEAILDGAEQADERVRLEALASGPPISKPAAPLQEPSAQPSVVPIVKAYEAGRFAEVIATFLADPKAEHADLAVEAILDSGATDHAVRVLELVRDLEDRGELTLSRRARRDLTELQQLVDNTCPGWLEWAVRVSGDARWPDASTVVRDHSGSWRSVGSLDSQQVSAVCDALLDATGGTNADQLRSSLDLLCNEAAAILSRGAVNDFCQVVLVLLSEQDNFSEMVRSAYLDLLAAWLEVGPSADDYGQILDQALDIWKRITSPVAVAWAVGVLEAATDLQCPDQARRTVLAVQLVDGARQHYSRLGLRERVEVETLAAELGLPAKAIEVQEAERDVWSALNGKVVGIYSLLPRAVGYLRNRLAQLCSVGEVRENHDEVATQALRTLAERADYLIVDTWHAAHQATTAIDSVRPRERQILPRQRGLTGFLRALEEALQT
jgi:hypothetical protein